MSRKMEGAAFIVNGLTQINGVEFWRIDKVMESRVGMEMLKKPSMLLLCEDHTRDAAMAIARRLEEESASRVEE